MAMNVFGYAAITEKNWKLNLEDMSGFKPQYTFYSDFGIAEFCEVFMRDNNAVKKTYNRVIKSWASSYKALVEIILVLNHKSWAFAQKVDSHWLNCGENWRNIFVNMYSKLYNEADNEFWKRYKDNKDAVSYYYSVLD